MIGLVLAYLLGAVSVVVVVGAIGYRERYLIADANAERRAVDKSRADALGHYLDEHRRAVGHGEPGTGPVRLPGRVAGGGRDAFGRVTGRGGASDLGSVNVGRLVLVAAIVSAVGFLTRYGLGGVL